MTRSIKQINIVLISILIGIFSISPDFVWADYVTEIDAFEYNGIEIPESDGRYSTVVNDNDPLFTEAEKAVTEPYETYSEFDSLNRVGKAQANIDKTSIEVGERGNIGSIYPTGWIQGNYDIVKGKWLYNRSHLYAHSLGGDDIARNLMTGTYEFNHSGMYDTFESIVLQYIKSSEENVHVLFRATPVFDDDDLLAKGILMEALCLEDPDFKTCIFCYNIQNGISIDYATGNNYLTDGGSPDNPSGKTDTDDSDNNDNPVTTRKSIKDLTISCARIKKYTGKYLKPSVTIKDGSKVLSKGTDYTIEYKNNKLPGKASVKLTGIGDYKGTMTLNFVIRPKKMKIIKSRGSKNSLTLKWQKHPGVTSYQIAYRQKGSSKFRYMTCRSTTTSKTITSLKAGKKYQVKIRALKQVSGKKYYSTYSKLKTVRIK